MCQNGEQEWYQGNINEGKVLILDKPHDRFEQIDLSLEESGNFSASLQE